MAERTPADAEAHLWQTMALLASLATAADVWKDVAARRMGRDPSAQEPASVVRPFLREAGTELASLLMRLQAGLASPPAASVLLVRRFDSLMMLRRVARLLHRIHQRLLSLYPDVPEQLVEEARLLEKASAALLDETTAYEARLSALLPRALRFVEALRREDIEGIEDLR